ncbi:hypothetical protein ACFQS7_24785 [Dankookia sp. GCM10030260]|uniref:hypothetical protein n=1 Tax=Dankookia sp. GCM10030260 TaxID=3273390 RepID=UPI00361DD43D
MSRKIILAVALTAFAGIGAAQAQRQATAAMMQPGQRMQIAAGLGKGTVQQVMISPDGGGIDIVYAMPAGAPESRRVLRLENVNGMLEVIYDTAMPQPMRLGSGGTPRLTPNGQGMYDVTYDKK